MSTKKQYKRLAPELIIESLMDFYESSSTSFREYCNEKGLNTFRVSLQRIGKKVNLFQAREDKTTASFIRRKLTALLVLQKKAEKKKLATIHHANKALTEDEIELVVSTCQELSIMGLGIDEDTCLSVVNSILKQRIDEKDFVEVTRGVIRRIIKSRKDLLTLMKGNSIDPKRARQAKVDVRDALFVKIDNFIKMLHSQGKVPWKSFADVPAHCINNMDEIATNAHDHRKKIIAIKNHLGRLYQEVNAGDNKMPFHITVCITSKGTGKLNNYNCFYFKGYYSLKMKTSKY